MCGEYGSLVVQRYNASSGFTLPCEPLGSGLQFAFCLQTGSSSTGQQTAESWTRIVTGRFNTTATVLQADTLTTVGAIIDGRSITPTNSAPVAVQLAEPASVTGLLDNDNTFIVPSGASTADEAAVTDANGLGFVTDDGETFVVYFTGESSGSNPFNVLQVRCSGGGACGQWASLAVQLYDASSGTGTVHCSPPTDAEVQAFSFCLITGSAATPQQSSATVATVTSGIWNATRAQSTDSYVVSALLSASQTVLSSSISAAAANVALLPTSFRVTGAGGGSVTVDNVFSYNADGLNSTQLDFYGLGLTSSLATFALNDGAVVEGSRDFGYGSPSVVQCQSGACGRFGQLVVAPYSTGDAVVDCQPLTDVLQVEFCSIVGSSALGQTVDTYTAVTYGVFNSTSPAASSLPAGQPLTIGAVVSAFQYTSTVSTPVNVSLAAVGSVSRDAGNGGNDNVVYFDSGSSVASFDSAGLALLSSYATLLLDSQGAYFAQSGVSQYSSLQLRLYNASAHPLLCSPTSDVIQFAFCLQTGSSEAEQTSATFSVVLSGIFNTTSPIISSTGVYQVATIVNGLLYTRAQLASVPVQVAPAGSVEPSGAFEFGPANDNKIEVDGGSGAVDNGGLAFQSELATFQFVGYYENKYVDVFSSLGLVYCVQGSCHTGDYGLLRVQVYNSSNPQQLECSLALAANVSSSSSSGGASTSGAGSSSTGNEAGLSSAAISSSSTSESFSTGSTMLPPSYKSAAYKLGSVPFTGRLSARFTQQSLYSNAYAPVLFLIGGQPLQGQTLPLTQAIWLSTDGGVSWSPVGSNLTLASIATLQGAGTAQLANGVLCLFGGVLANGSAISTVVYTRDGFATVAPRYDAPFSSRYDMAYTTIPGTNTLLFCAGLTTTSVNTSAVLVPSNDCWLATDPQLGAASWQKQTAEGPFPAALNNAALVALYDNSSTLLLCGGAVDGQAISLCWVSSSLAVNWTTGITAAWGARSGLVMVSDLDGWAYLYGGQDNSGAYYYDLWVSTDQTASWFQVVVPGGIEIEGASLAFSYTVYTVGGVVGTYKQVVFVGGVDAATGQAVADTTAAVVVFPAIPSQLTATLPAFPDITDNLLQASECQFTINVAGTIAGFGVSSYSGNPLLTASAIAGLAGAVLGVPASAVQVCVHIQYAYPGFDADVVFVLLPNVSVNTSSPVLSNLTSVITNGTNSTVTSQPGTLPVSPPTSSSPPPGMLTAFSSSSPPLSSAAVMTGALSSSSSASSSAAASSLSSSVSSLVPAGSSSLSSASMSLSSSPALPASQLRLHRRRCRHCPRRHPRPAPWLL